MSERARRRRQARRPLWNQYTDWPAFRAAAVRADELGYDYLWTWDHLYPIVGDRRRPMFEGWTDARRLGASATEHARLGLMVGANTFRNPALVAKMVTTLDHISGGRAILGIGGAWFETEHTRLRDRVRRLARRAAALARRGGRASCAACSTASSPSRRAASTRRRDVPQRPAARPGAPADPDRRRRRAADAAHRRPLRGRLQHRRRPRERQAQGRGAPPPLRGGRPRRGGDRADRRRRRPIIRDDPAEARRVFDAIFERNGDARRWQDQPVGTPEQVAEQLRAVPGHRLPAPDLRLPRAVRRGDAWSG